MKSCILFVCVVWPSCIPHTTSSWCECTHTDRNGHASVNSVPFGSNSDTAFRKWSIMNKSNEEKNTDVAEPRERESEKKPSRTTNTNTKPFDGFNFQFKIANSIAFYQELPLNTGNTLWQMVNFYYIWIKTQCQFYYTLSVSHCQCSTIYSSLFPLPFSSAAFYLYIVALSLSLLPARLFSIVSYFFYSGLHLFHAMAFLCHRVESRLYFFFPIE